MANQRKRKEDHRHSNVDSVVAEYYQRIDGGESVDAAALIRAYPEFADELNEFFSAEKAMGLDAPTAAYDAAGTKKNAIRIHCPHCRVTVAVAADASLADIRCESCDGTFNLAASNNPTNSATAVSNIAHFELIERLGVGGFGSVWKARDTKLDRAVAVKIPLRGQLDEKETEKFLREARTAAQLKHPNIVTVHEVGRDEDTVYIVSDLIRGVTVDDWLTGHQPTFRESAELCSKIAKALEHAHQQGVIHRDLKPGNIMLDANNEPHLMDFGLARREVGEVTVTMDGAIMGTPAYMSPEQAQGEAHLADSRSDVYSLGVVLFKLLTGELPFRGNIRMLIHQVVNDEPPSPRKLNNNIPRDLETICLKCMEKKPDRRYSTATEVRDELQRFLDGKAIVARPTSRVEKTWKWSRRHKALASLVALLVILGIVGPIVAVQQSVLRKKNSELAEQRLDALGKAETQRKEAMKNLEYARKGNEILGSIFADLRPVQGYATVAELRDALHDNLSSAVEELENFAIGDRNAVAEMQSVLGKTMLALGDYDNAIRLLNEALNAKKEAIGSHSTLIEMNNLALAYSKAGNKEQALRFFRRSLELHESALGSDDPDTLIAMGNLGTHYRDLNEFDKAIPLLQQSLDNHISVLGPDHPNTLVAMGNLAAGYRDARLQKKAVPLLEESLALCIKNLPPNHPSTLVNMNNLAAAYRDVGRFDEAISLWNQVLERSEALLGARHPDTLTGLANLGVGYRDAGNIQQALSFTRRALEARSAKLGTEHPDTLTSVDNLAMTYLYAGQLKQALPLLEKNLENRKSRLGPEHPDTLTSMHNLAEAYRDSGSPEKAVRLLEQCLEIALTKLDPDHPSILTFMHTLASGYNDLRQYDKALPLFRKTLERRQAVLDGRHPSTLSTMCGLATCLNLAGETEEAIRICEDTLELQKTVLGTQHRDTLTSMDNLASYYKSAGELSKAVQIWQQTLELRERNLGVDHPDSLTSRNNLAVGYGDAGQLGKAIGLLEQNLELWSRNTGFDNPRTLTTIKSLANYLQLDGQLDESISLTKKRWKLLESRYGKNDIQTLNCMERLAWRNWMAGQLDESIPLFEDLLLLFQNKFDRDHRRTQFTIANLGKNYLDANRVDDAIPLLEEAYGNRTEHPSLAGWGLDLLRAYVEAGRAESFATVAVEELARGRKKINQESLELANFLSSMANAYRRLEFYNEAAKLLRECVDIHNQQAPDAWNTFHARSLLGWSLFKLATTTENEFQKSQLLQEAEDLLRSGYSGMKEREGSIPANAASRIPEALDRLIEFYTEVEKPEEATKYRQLREQVIVNEENK